MQRTIQGRKRSLARAICCVAAAGVVITGWTLADGSGSPSASAGLTLPFEERERSVAPEAVPAAARSALERRAGGEPIQSFEQEIRGGKSYYEAEWTIPQGEREATVSAEGILVEIETDIAPDQVPPSVRATAEQQAGGKPIQYSRRVFITYEAEYVADGMEHELTIWPAGELLHEHYSPVRQQPR